jgi:hypothetical protein
MVVLDHVEVAVEVPQQYIRTDVVPGDTTLYKEIEHEETGVIRWLCLQERYGIWRCAACNQGKLTMRLDRCRVCKRKVSIRYLD